MLLQHHNQRRDARAEEDVGRQSDDAVNLVLLNQFLANLSFAVILRVATEQHTVGQYDGHDAVGFQVV